MKSAIRAAAIVAIGVALALDPTTSALASHHFGDTPYAKVLSNAQDHAGDCGAVSKNKVAARMLSITWNEVTDGVVTRNPSPMTLGRWDWDADLFWDANTNAGATRRRAFWHAGIGMWQVDDAGLGSNMASNKFSADGSASVVANYIADQLCSGGNPFAAWYGCNGGACQTDYNQIYSSSGLQDMDTSLSMADFGGTQTHDCRGYTPPQVPPLATFTCRYVKAANAQGYTANWTANQDGDNSIHESPQAMPFYDYSFTNAAGNKVEARVWLTQDTPFSATLQMKRVFGNDSRNGLVYDDTFVGLCDDTRGVCSHN